MGDVIQLFGEKAVHPSDDAIDVVIVAELRRQAKEIGDAVFDLEALVRDFDDEVALADMLFANTQQERMAQLHRIIVNMKAFLFRELGLSHTAHVILIEQRGMRFMSLESIALHVLETNRMQWIARSSYFAALAIEFDARMHRYKLMTRSFV